jgi:glycerophosphoryl diester phosphodiesterase
MKYLVLLTFLCFTQAKGQLKFENFEEISGYFSYTGAKKNIISGHRGTHIPNYPENSLEGFAHVLHFSPAFFEVDPRLTKDSVIVLLHDATLDRTTTGTGKLADYTWEEVKKLKLKDRHGKITPYRIPTLQEAMDWAKGKAVLNLDKKDVPLERIAEIIQKNKAENYMMVTVHNAEQAQFYYNNNPNLMMSSFVKTEKAFREYEEAGIPWKNMIAYIGSEDKPENKVMFDLLHAKGVSCMLSSAPSYDKLKTAEERGEAYRRVFANGADILESDYPIEVWRALQKK